MIDFTKNMKCPTCGGTLLAFRNIAIKEEMSCEIEYKILTLKLECMNYKCTGGRKIFSTEWILRLS